MVGQHGHLRARGGHPLLHDRGLLGAGTGKDHVVGALFGQPAGHMSGALVRRAGQQNGAVRGPAAHRLPVLGAGAHQPAPQYSRGAHGKLVLAVRGAEHPHEAVERGLVQGGGQVDDAAPPLGVLQRHDPCQAPELSGDRIRGGVGAGGAHGARGQTPQRRGDAVVAQRLQQGDRRRERTVGAAPVRGFGQRLK